MRWSGVVVVCVLVACSPGGDGDTQRAGRASRTGRFAVTIAANDATRAVSLRATGAFDDANGRYTLAMTTSQLLPGLDGEVTIIETPDALYVECAYLARLLAAPTKWISVRGATGHVVDVRSWLDGLVSSSTMRFDAAGEKGSAELSVRYFDLGAPVAIEPPPEVEVTDMTDEFNRIAGGDTGG
jgi:hypothetical protein